MPQILNESIFSNFLIADIEFPPDFSHKKPFASLTNLWDYLQLHVKLDVVIVRRQSGGGHGTRSIFYCTCWSHGEHNLRTTPVARQLQ